MKILVACDKFKGSLTAKEVNDALTAGIGSVMSDAHLVSIPVADGGDGTLQAALDVGFERHDVDVPGPVGTGTIRTAYARRGDTAVVELADSAGLCRLDAALAPLDASTYGTGLVMKAAIEAGCTRIVLGVGGSASTDGGSGLLAGLGAHLLDRAGCMQRPCARNLGAVVTLDLDAVNRLLRGVSVTLACDVDNPLLGVHGAARTFGPQKGASTREVNLMEASLDHWADLVEASVGCDHRDRPGAGAAGGTGFGALAVLKATCVPGVDVVLDLVDFGAALEGADLLVTGEGSLDEQSLRGKAPIGVVRAAVRAGVPAVAVCGRNQLTQAQVRAAGLTNVWSLDQYEADPGRSMGNAAQLLNVVGKDLARICRLGPLHSTEANPAL